MPVPVLLLVAPPFLLPVPVVFLALPPLPDVEGLLTVGVTTAGVVFVTGGAVVTAGGVVVTAGGAVVTAGGVVAWCVTLGVEVFETDTALPCFEPLVDRACFATTFFLTTSFGWGANLGIEVGEVTATALTCCAAVALDGGTSRASMCAGAGGVAVSDFVAVPTANAAPKAMSRTPAAMTARPRPSRRRDPALRELPASVPPATDPVAT
jgi:hypothetical protein